MLSKFTLFSRGTSYKALFNLLNKNVPWHNNYKEFASLPNKFLDAFCTVGLISQQVFSCTVFAVSKDNWDYTCVLWRYLPLSINISV